MLPVLETLSALLQMPFVILSGLTLVTSSLLALGELKFRNSSAAILGAICLLWAWTVLCIEYYTGQFPLLSVTGDYVILKWSVPGAYLISGVLYAVAWFQCRQIRFLIISLGPAFMVCTFAMFAMQPQIFGPRL
jgi:hypothetical protein